MDPSPPPPPSCYGAESKIADENAYLEQLAYNNIRLVTNGAHPCFHACAAPMHLQPTHMAYVHPPWPRFFPPATSYVLADLTTFDSMQDHLAVAYPNHSLLRLPHNGWPIDIMLFWSTTGMPYFICRFCSRGLYSPSRIKIENLDAHLTSHDHRYQIHLSITGRPLVRRLEVTPITAMTNHEAYHFCRYHLPIEMRRACCLAFQLRDQIRPAQFTDGIRHLFRACYRVCTGAPSTEDRREGARIEFVYRQFNVISDAVSNLLSIVDRMPQGELPNLSNERYTYIETALTIFLMPGLHPRSRGRGRRPESERVLFNARRDGDVVQQHVDLQFSLPHPLDADQYDAIERSVTMAEQRRTQEVAAARALAADMDRSNQPAPSSAGLIIAAADQRARTAVHLRAANQQARAASLDCQDALNCHEIQRRRGDFRVPIPYDPAMPSYSSPGSMVDSDVEDMPTINSPTVSSDSDEEKVPLDGPTSPSADPQEEPEVVD